MGLDGSVPLAKEETAMMAANRKRIMEAKAKREKVAVKGPDTVPDDGAGKGENKNKRRTEKS